MSGSIYKRQVGIAKNRINKIKGWITTATCMFKEINVKITHNKGCFILLVHIGHGIVKSINKDISITIRWFINDTNDNVFLTSARNFQKTENRKYHYLLIDHYAKKKDRELCTQSATPPPDLPCLFYTRVIVDA